MTLKTTRGERKKKIYGFNRNKKHNVKEDAEDGENLLNGVKPEEEPASATSELKEPVAMDGKQQSWHPFETEEFKKAFEENETPPTVTADDEASLDNLMANLQAEFANGEKEGEEEVEQQEQPSGEVGNHRGNSVSSTDGSENKTETTDGVSAAATKVAAGAVAGFGYVMAQATKCTEPCTTDVTSKDDNDTIFSFSQASTGIIEKEEVEDQEEEVEKAEVAEEQDTEPPQDPVPEEGVENAEDTEKPTTQDTSVDVSDDGSQDSPVPRDPKPEGPPSFLDSLFGGCVSDNDLGFVPMVSRAFKGLLPQEPIKVDLDKSFDGVIFEEEEKSHISGLTLDKVVVTVSKNLPKDYRLDEDFSTYDALKGAAKGAAERLSPQKESGEESQPTESEETYSKSNFNKIESEEVSQATISSNKMKKTRLRKTLFATQ